MSSYSDAITAFLAGKQAEGDTDVPTGTLILARACEACFPGSIAVNPTGLFLTFRGKQLSSARDLALACNVPGIRFIQPTMVQASGLSPLSPGSGAASEYDDVSAISDAIGADNVSFITTVLGMIDSKLSPAGIFDQFDLDRIRAANAHGIIALPASASLLTGLGYPATLAEPSLDGTRIIGWRALAALFDTATKTYNSKNLIEASRQVKAAQDNVDFWNSVYSAVEAVRDAPANVVFGLPGFIADALGAKNLLLIGLVAAGIAAFVFLPRIAAVKALVTK